MSSSAAAAAGASADPPPEQGPPSSSKLAFTFADKQMEDVFLVYTAEKNRGLTLRLHYMLIAAWAVGALKTVSQAAYVYRQGKQQSSLVLHGFLLAAQLVNLVYQSAAMGSLRSIDRKDQLAQESTKAWLHVLLDMAVMVCVILSDPALPHAPTPLSTMVVTSFITVLDMVRLETMLRLHVIKWMCFLLLEGDLLVRVPGYSLGRIGVDILFALLLGTLLPLAFAAGSEGSQREDFLRDGKKNPRNLGNFWTGVNLLLGRLPGRVAAGDAGDHLHED